MALNFVAAEDGLEEDPKILTLARILKVDRAHAFWFVMRWRRLVVHAGNALSGSLPKNYTNDDLAAFLDWSGKPATLTQAMKSTGFLGFKRGRGIFYPGWAHTITGNYASARESERSRKERERLLAKKAKLGQGADGPGTVRGQGLDASADSPRTGEGNLTLRKERASADAPPDPPPAGGALGEERWRWILENAPTPQNQRVCERILATMPEAEWDLVQLAYERAKAARSGVGTPIGRVFRCVEWPTDRFLQTQAYFRFRPRGRPGRNASTTPKVVELDPAAALELRLQNSDGYLMELLADPEVPEAKKQAARERWETNPDNEGRPPPWKALPTAPTNGHRAKGLPS